jgi:hypothetical protein
VIELRRKLERARTHPILGPIVVVVLVLVLAMVLLHVLHDSHEAAVDLGAVCIAMAVAFTFFMLDRSRRVWASRATTRRAGRAPPFLVRAAVARPRIRADAPHYLPLRR